MRNASSPCTPECSSQSYLSFLPLRDFLWRLIFMPHFIIIQETALDFVSNITATVKLEASDLGCIFPTILALISTFKTS